jgi:hypothetical protein
MKNEEDVWEMHEPKDGFTLEDEWYLLQMLKNMPIPREIILRSKKQK